MRKLALLIICILSLLLGLPALAQDSGTVTDDMLVVAPELFDRASQAFQAQDYERAVLDISMFIFLNPTYSRGYYLRALSYQSLEQPENALADLSQAIAHTPSPDAQALLHMTSADIYAQQEDYDAALDELDAAIEAAPESPDPYVFRARVYAQQERYEDALDDYNHALTLAPDSLDVYIGRALLHQELGNYQEAVDDFTHVIESDSQNAALYLGRGAVYREAGDDAEAAADFLEWIRLNSTNVNQDHQMRIGQSIQLEMQEGLVFVIPFEANAGQVVNIEATGAPGAEIDPILVLLDPDQAPVAGDDDGGGDLNAAIFDYTIPANGVYVVVLSHSGGGASGSVVVKLGASGS